jgi:hypothetical protein
MMRSHQSWRTADMQRRRLFVAMLLSELLPIDGASAGTIRNRTQQESRAPAHAIETAQRTTTPPGGAVVVGLDGGYVHSRHRQEERHFEAIAGKVINAAGTQQRFAFVRNDKAVSADTFAQTLAVAGMHSDTLATVLCD